MKLIIDIPDEMYDCIKKDTESEMYIIDVIKKGIPYEPKGDLIRRKYVESIVKAEFVDLQDGTEEWRTYVNEACENILNKVDNAPTVYPICEDKACKYRADMRGGGKE